MAFYDMMKMKSKALKKQLETPELQSINPIIMGELKAVKQLKRLSIKDRPIDTQR